jgi:hypothetical protein
MGDARAPGGATFARARAALSDAHFDRDNRDLGKSTVQKSTIPDAGVSRIRHARLRRNFRAPARGRALSAGPNLAH